MKYDVVRRHVGDLPWMNPRKGRLMWDFLTTHRLYDCLELGFFHGVSSAYIAAALDEMDGGHLVSIDLASAKRRRPNIEGLLVDLNLRDRVTPFYEPTSYTWRLMKMLEENPTPRFDFCYIDGGHGWDDTGYAFFLVERLLRPGGWIIFDDVTWTFADSPTLGHTERVRRMPAEERDTPQVGKVFELLVKPHPHFDRCEVRRDWGYARKTPGEDVGVVSSSASHTS
ncbi:MAG: class I SAM-dependent methyltransferase [Planctomycetes bacterium]|nr:class I SAM-dependent methyltransferase [Planctomycetota bacterium]